MTATVLITGARSPVALDLARAFRAAGYQAHLADCVTPWAAWGLRPRPPIHRFPSPRADFRAFRLALLALQERLNPVLVVPTCEEVFWLAAAAERDGWAARLFAPDLALLRRLHSKLAFVELAREAGLDAPETWTLDGGGQAPSPLWLGASRPSLSRCTGSEQTLHLRDLVLKPEFSRFSTHTLIAPSEAALASLAPSPRLRWAAQRRIEGTEICSWAAVRRGEIVAYAAYRPRWRHGAAAAYQFEAVDIPAVAEVTRRIARTTGMTGHLSFDIILEREGRAYPIECNPRGVSGLHLYDADASLARAILGEGVVASPPRGRLRHMAPAMALLGLPAAVRAGRLSALIADWREGQDVIARRDGAGVTLGCLMDAARFAAVAVAKGLTPAGATTADIEWDGEPIA